MPRYDKLVRDLIPDIIEKTGKAYRVRTLADPEYQAALQQKLHEEVEEYIQADNATQAKEELADVLEVMRALAKVHGSTMEEIEQIRLQKAEERGGFAKRIFLMEVDE